MPTQGVVSCRVLVSLFSRHLHGHLRQSGKGSGAPGERGAQGDAGPAKDHPDGRLRLQPGGARPALRRPRASHAGSGGMTGGDTVPGRHGGFRLSSARVI